MSYSGTVTDESGKSFNISISLSEIVNVSPVAEVEAVANETATEEVAEPGTVEAQERPSN